MKSPIDGELADLWSRVLDGETLSADEEARLVAGAGTDPEWLAAVDRDGAFHGWLTGLGEAQRDPGFVARVVERVRAEHPVRTAAPAAVQARRPSRSWRPRTYALAAAAAGVLLVVAVLRHDGGAPESPVLVQTLGTTAPDSGNTSAASLPSVLRGVDAPPGLVAKGAVTSTSLDERLPTGTLWRYGEVGPCPPGGSGRCVRAVRYDAPHTERVGIQVRADGALFTYDDDLYLRFDYWVGSTTGEPYRLQIELGDQHPTGATDIVFPLGPAVTWNRVLVPLSALRWSKDRQVGLPRGLPISAMQFVLWFSTNDLFVIDNVEVVRFGPAGL